MNFEGKCEIQLTDVKSGNVRTLKSDNMFTNALQNILEMPMEIFKDTTNTNIMTEMLNPIATNALGGVYLFRDNINEHLENVVPPFAENLLTGHAGGEYSGTESRRGNYNADESGVVDGGYRFVWDFSTNQANGTISNVCLTSRLAGNIGVGQPNTVANHSIGTSVGTINSWGGGSEGAQENIQQIGDIIYTATAGTSTIYAPGSSLVIRSYDNRTSDIGINDILYRSSQSLATSTLIQAKTLVNDSQVTLTTPHKWFNFRDNKAHSVYAASTDELHYAVIDLERAEIIQSKIITANGLNAPTSAAGRMINYFIRKGEIYLISSTDTIKKVSIDTGAVTSLEIEGASGFTVTSAYQGFNFEDTFCGFYTQSGSTYAVLLPGDKMIVSQNTSLTATNRALTTLVTKHDKLKYPWAVFAKRQSLNFSQFSYALLYPYLATINNIGTVTKTPSQTMKIIYTVTKTID
ncbi:hypothetical protein [Enterococcus sp.]|uniref:hypothetical protein n=1 Tax=Enterococcus sp. TaxID=35783 RepID=UPI00289E8AB6|nr:hypothetical protein [Enterococcus sp.]